MSLYSPKTPRTVAPGEIFMTQLVDVQERENDVIKLSFAIHSWLNF